MDIPICVKYSEEAISIIRERVAEWSGKTAQATN